MVFVKVRETYDLHTKKNKMTVIGIHTPKPDIIKRNYPGLLMQCRAYRPVSADVRIACASVLPLDPLGVGTGDGDVAPEDVFNPILYKAMSNKGMSQLEARINMMRVGSMAGVDVDGSTAAVDVDDVTGETDEFPIYYGLLANTHEWKHANPQAGLEMRGLRPLVYEMVYNVGDMRNGIIDSVEAAYAAPNGSTRAFVPLEKIIGKAKEFPFLNCTSYTYTNVKEDEEKDPKTPSYAIAPGFSDDGTLPYNAEQEIPYLHVFCGCIIIPPSRMHELFFRMVCEWTLEFTALRPISEIADWGGVARVGNAQHYQNYSYSKVKEALTGDDSSQLTGDSCMVSANVDVEKVM